MLANFSDTPLVIPKSTVLGVAEQVSEAFVDRVNTARPCSDPPTETQHRGKNEAIYTKFVKGKVDHLHSKDREKIKPVLVKYAHVFHDEESNDFKATDVVEHEIILQDTTPIRRPQYRTHFALKDEMKAQVDNILPKGKGKALHRGRRQPFSYL